MLLGSSAGHVAWECTHIACVNPGHPLLPPVAATPTGEGQVSEQRIVAAVAAAPEAPNRLRAICRQLSLLAREALPRPAVAAEGDGTFHAGWTNPLFGSAPPVSAQS